MYKETFHLTDETQLSQIHVSAFSYKTISGLTSIQSPNCKRSMLNVNKVRRTQFPMQNQTYNLIHTDDKFT